MQYMHSDSGWWPLFNNTGFQPFWSLKSLKLFTPIFESFLQKLSQTNTQIGFSCTLRFILSLNSPPQSRGAYFHELFGPTLEGYFYFIKYSYNLNHFGLDCTSFPEHDKNAFC